jgi:hypothetical protein
MMNPIKKHLTLTGTILGILVSILTLTAWLKSQHQLSPTEAFLLCDSSGRIVPGIVAILANGRHTAELVPDHDGLIFVSREYVDSTLSIRDEITRQEIYHTVLPEFGSDVAKIVIPK